MASFKDSASRPLAQAIPSPRQPGNGRSHSHSVSLGALNYNHRVTRRKSMTSSAHSAAAAATAALIGESGALHTSHHRRGLSMRRAAGLESTSAGSPSALASSYAARGSGLASALDRRQPTPGAVASSAVSEDLSAAAAAGKPITIKQRSRRASEGSHLMKAEGKRSLVELKCDRCGKGYKHSSCLTKHMWEHDPAWAVTSKLLISKHQQVQLLEAASVLVTLNEPAADDSAIHTAASGESDRSSASPTASGITELRDGLSSTETTPPPMGEDGAAAFSKSNDFRYSSNSNSNTHSHPFSRSLQSSIPSNSFASASSVPSFSPARSHFRQSSTDTRPSTADTSGVLDDDAAGLAAAIELCNFGTPRSGPMTILEDVPPVPPLPARYLGQSVGSTMALAGNPSNGFLASSTGNFSSSGSGSATVRASSSNLAASTPTVFNTLSMGAHAPISYRLSDERDVKMADIQPDIAEHSKTRKPLSSSADDDFDRASPSSVVHHIDDDDDGVFGRMEE